MNEPTVYEQFQVDPKAWWRVVRRMEKRYAYRIGTLTIRWNRLHYFLTAFGAQIPAGPSHKELIRLGAISNNERVREELRKIVLACGPELDRTNLREAFLWVLDQLPILEQLRNGFIHHCLTFPGVPGAKAMVDPLMTMDRYQEVKREPDLAFRVLRSDVDALMAYAVWSFSHFANSTLTPVPKRPALKVTSSFPDLVRRKS